MHGAERDTQATEWFGIVPPKDWKKITQCLPNSPQTNRQQRRHTAPRTDEASVASARARNFTQGTRYPLAN